MGICGGRSDRDLPLTLQPFHSVYIPSHPLPSVYSFSSVSYTTLSSLDTIAPYFLEIANMSAQAVAHLPPTPPHEPAKLSRMATSSSTASKPQHKHIWVITGPAGCGKTSVAEHLHSSLQYDRRLTCNPWRPITTRTSWCTLSS